MLRLVLSLAAALILLGGPAIAVSATTQGETDPTGDARAGAGGASKAELAAVDITLVSYTLDDKTTLTATTEVAQLADVPGNEFVETVVRTGGRTLDFSTQIGTSTVKVFDGDHFYTCAGARVTVKDSRVTQRLPLSCLHHADRGTFQPEVTLAKDNGTPIASDRAGRVGPFGLGPS